jgi:hypothetical protein
MKSTLRKAAIISGKDTLENLPKNIRIEVWP